MPTPQVPFAPPRSCTLPPIAGRLGYLPEHFLVEEIPAYPLSGSGEHVFLFVEKTSLNTTDVTKRIADVTKVRERDIGYAGMKDKHAVTRQWFSFLYREDNAASLDLGPGVRILQATRHNNKLRTGHLIGNRFELTFINTEPGDPEKAQAILEHLMVCGMPNYFGPQRFGHGGRNLEQARRWLSELAQKGQGTAEKSEDRGRKSRDKKKKGGRFENKLHPSVVQSEFFNRYCAARLQLEQPLLLGEVVRLHQTAAHFVVEDLAQELPRKAAGDLWLSGELPGGKTVHAKEDALVLEQKIMEQMNLSAEELSALKDSAPGARRDLVVIPENFVFKDSAPGTLCVSFSLPSGSFATQVAYEMSACDFAEPRLRPPLQD